MGKVTSSINGSIRAIFTTFIVGAGGFLLALALRWATPFCQANETFMSGFATVKTAAFTWLGWV